MDNKHDHESTDAITHDLENLSDDLQEQSSQMAGKFTAKTTSEMDEAAEAAEAVAAPLEEKGYDSLSGYVREIGGYLDKVSSTLKEKSADELIDDARSLARDNPMLLLAGGFAIGLGIARVAKAGMDNSRSAEQDPYLPSDGYSKGDYDEIREDYYRTSRTGEGVADTPEVTWESASDKLDHSLETNHY